MCHESKEPDFRKRVWRLKGASPTGTGYLLELFLPEFNTVIGSGCGSALPYHTLAPNLASVMQILANWNAYEEKRYQEAMEYYRKTRP